MKSLITTTLALACAVSLWAQGPSATPMSSPEGGLSDQQQDSRTIKREEREKAREAKAAEYVHFIDSLVMSHNFTFMPSNFQMEPAGRTRQITNPNFRLGYYPDYVDVMLPYYGGMTPPYLITVLNKTVPNPDAYVFKQTKHGWEISFKSSLYTSNNYTFVLTVYSTTGEAELNIDSDFLNEVTYSGTIIGNN